MIDGQKNKGGRPRKHPIGSRRPTLAFRVRGDMHEQLSNAAKQNGRSVSEEIERRLEASFNPNRDQFLNEMRRVIREELDKDHGSSLRLPLRKRPALSEPSSTL